MGVTIFVLKLKNNKYFVGKSTGNDFLILNHFKSYENEWTKKYEPIGIKELIKNCEEQDVDKYTLEYMAEYGAFNVRGGKYSKIKLEEKEKYNINRTLKDNEKSCYICGNKEHISEICNKFWEWNLDLYENDLYDIEPTNKAKDCDNCVISKISAGKKKNIDTDYDIVNAIGLNDIICYRCGRKGHLVDNCYAISHFNGASLDRCHKCGRENHTKTECKYNIDIYGRPISNGNNTSYVYSLISGAKDKCYSVIKYFF